MRVVGIKYKNYCIRDSDLREASNFLKLKNAAAYTFGGLSKQWLKIHKIKNLKLKLTIKEEILLRNNFFQNRIEVFTLITNKQLNQNLYSIDFNQLYLNLLKQALPIKTFVPQIKTKYDKNILAFYYIKFWAPENIEPILPYNCNKLTYFCTGIGEGVYWCEEIEYFLQKGGKLLKIEMLCAFKSEAPLLKPFMELLKLYPNRRERKNMANQLFGHMGMKKWKYKKQIKLSRDFNLDENIVKRMRQMGNFLLIETYEIELIRNAVENLAWALIITAKARILLHKLIISAQKLGISIYFINTDEIIVNEHININKLKLEWNNMVKIKKIDNNKIQQIIEIQPHIIYKRKREENTCNFIAWKK